MDQPMCEDWKKLIPTKFLNLVKLFKFLKTRNLSTIKLLNGLNIYTATNKVDKYSYLTVQAQ